MSFGESMQELGNFFVSGMFWFAVLVLLVLVSIGMSIIGTTRDKTKK